MANLIRPILFSKKFACSSHDFTSAGLIEPILNCDTKLFIDPTLIESSANPTISRVGFKLLTETYKHIIKLVAASKKENDVAWKGARRLVNLDECPGLHLGYGGSRTTGSSRPLELRDVILRTTKEIIALGETDPSLLSLVGLFEEGVGPDTIGDFTGHCIYGALVKVSEDFYRAHGLPTEKFAKLGNAELVPNISDPSIPIILVPKDIVRDLPLATDWSDVSTAISQADEIRQRFDKFFIGVAEPTITEKKQALRDIALSSRKMFRLLLEALLELATNYDPNDDVFAYYALRSILAGEIATEPKNAKPLAEESLDALHNGVLAITEHFKKQVEKNNLWELLWVKTQAKRERASQLVYFGVADVFCKANGWDISPETNMGGGPVDFKFSSGYQARVLVELKKSSGAVVSGYKKQLEIYREASETDRGVFVVIDVGGMGRKLDTIRKIQKMRLSAGERASDIVVVDARRKISASKDKA
tara:strand:- start:75 stop:1505 length:1431 start_codon:yes stop_codon:yes gene_type:complete